MQKWPILITAYSLGHGGCERDAAKIATGIDRTNFEPHVAVFREGGYRVAEVEAAGVPILALPVRSFRNSTFFEGARMLGAYIRKHGIVLTHSFDVPLNIFTAPVARFYGVPVIVTSQLSYRNMYTRFERTAMILTDRLSQTVVVNSRAVGDSLVKAGMPGEKVYLSYNGVLPREFYPGEGRRPDGWDGHLVVGSLCVMREEKRMDWLIRSFAELRGRAPNLRLLLVGNGAEVPRLMALRDELGLEQVCRFQEGQPNVAEWLRGMDIYANCSRSESFPNALLEAMACGCCVVGSNVGGIPELITHARDGLIFDSTDRDDLTRQLQRAIDDSNLRNNIRREAVRTAHERFSMDIALRRTESLYKTLLESRNVAKRELATC